MKPETISALYKVKDLMKQAREVLDTRMYRSEDSLELPEEDRAYCRKVYDAVCKVMDNL